MNNFGKNFPCEPEGKAFGCWTWSPVPCARWLIRFLLCCSRALHLCSGCFSLRMWGVPTSVARSARFSFLSPLLRAFWLIQAAVRTESGLWSVISDLRLLLLPLWRGDVAPLPLVMFLVLKSASMPPFGGIGLSRCSFLCGHWKCVLCNMQFVDFQK